MHQQKGKKILAYFFILLAFGSINNIELKNSSFYKIKNIKISGFNEEETNILIKKINKLNLQNIFFLNYNELNKLLNSNSLIETFKIVKKYPSTLDIKIKKTKFLANINNDNQPYLIGSNGKLIKNNSFNPQLPYVFGKPGINEFLEFKKIIDQSQFSYNEIEKLYFFPSKRWDLKLKSEILLKLSKNFTEDSLNNIFDFLEDYNNDKMIIVDTRVNNQIILNE